MTELVQPLQQIVKATLKDPACRPFMLMDGSRGRAEQEKAFAQGNSKVHFGDSAHNWKPALAFDFAPLDGNGQIPWKDKKAWLPHARLFLAYGRQLKIPLRWLGDPNGDGNISDGWDFPHIELHPWRNYRNLATLIDY